MNEPCGDVKGHFDGLSFFAGLVFALIAIGIGAAWEDSRARDATNTMCKNAIEKRLDVEVIVAVCGNALR